MDKKNKNIEISVIVPFLNEEKYIEKCIKSLISQNYSRNKYELVFVDNGSKDNSAALVSKYPNVKLIKEASKRSGATARNAGLRVAKGKYIAFTDADCVVSKNWLSQAYKHLSTEKLVIVMGDRYLPGNSGVLKLVELFENFRASEVLTSHKRRYYFCYSNNMVIDQKIFERVGLLNDYYFCYDNEWLSRVLNTVPKTKLVYEPKMSITHMEITNPLIWIKKFYNYGKDYPKFVTAKTFIRVMPVVEQLKIFLSLVKKYNINIMEGLALLSILAMKSLSFKWGSFRGRTILR